MPFGITAPVRLRRMKAYRKAFNGASSAKKKLSNFTLSTLRYTFHMTAPLFTSRLLAKIKFAIALKF